MAAVSEKAESASTALLPMEEYAPQFLKLLHDFQVAIVIGETGCGKTTKIPQILLDNGYAEKGLIVCTEPRRLAAIASARRVSQERKEQVGSTIGYQVRFEEMKGESTKVLYVTDGVLMHQVRRDPYLRRYSVIVVDEAHERNIYTDFTLAYLKALCQRRKDLKVIISSATINPTQFMAYFSTLGFIQVPGRLYPVEVNYREYADDLITSAAYAIGDIHQHNQRGDILVFLPGIGEIRAVSAVLARMELTGIVILPLYGGMEPSQQEHIFAPAADRKIILATNVAETSLTIPGVRYVIDTGYARLPGYDTGRQVDTLYLTRISQASANQRMGRAGRTQAGVCFRLVPKQVFDQLPRYTEPEILRSDLTGFVLNAKRHRISDVAQLDLLTRPPRHLITQAIEELQRLGAVDHKGRITDFGKQLARISIEPILARFLSIASEEGCLKEAAIIAAFLSVRNIFFREGGMGGFVDRVPKVFQDPMGDLFSYLRVWFSCYTAKEHPGAWCRAHRINSRVMLGISNIRKQIIEEARRVGWRVNSSSNRDVIGRAIVRAFAHNLCVKEKDGTYRSGDRAGIKISKSSSLATRRPEQFVAVSFLDTGTLWASGNVEVQPEWQEAATASQPQAVLKGELPFVISGTIHLTDDQGSTRTMQLRFNPGREAQTSVQSVAEGCLALDLRRLPFLNIQALAAVAPGLSLAYPLTNEERQAPFPVIFEEDEQVREQIAAGEALDDRLLERFLDQPFEVLGLSPGVSMKFWAVGVKTVRDVTECREEDLQRKIGRGRARTSAFRFSEFDSRAVKFAEAEVEEVKSALAIYNLWLKEDWEVRDADLMPEEVMKAYSVQVDEVKAMAVLGVDDFTAFLAMHQAGASRERLRCRNELIERHVRLAWKMAITYEWSIPSYKQDPANEGQDYAQEGCIGLMRAVVKFDPLGGNRFATYAPWWIRQAIWRFIQNSGVVRIPVHRCELHSRILAQMFNFEQKHGQKPSLEELGELVRLSPAETRAALDEMQTLRNIRRLEECRYPTGASSSVGSRAYPATNQDRGDEVKLFGDSIEDERANFERELINRQLRNEISQMLIDAPITEMDRRLVELRFGLNGEDEHDGEEISSLFNLSPWRVKLRLEKVLASLRTRGNWERINAHYELRPLPEMEAFARWERAITALLQVLAEAKAALEAEEVWAPETFLEIMAQYLGLTMDQLVAKLEDSTSNAPSLRVAKAAAAALLWSPCNLRLDEIASRLQYASPGYASNAIHQVRAQLVKRKHEELAKAYQPEKPPKTKDQASKKPLEDLWDEASEQESEPAWIPISPEEIAEARALLDQVEMTPRQRLILEERLGLDKPPSTLEEVAKKVGVTRERVRQIQVAVIERIQHSSVGPALWPVIQSFLPMNKKKQKPKEETSQSHAPVQVEVPEPSPAVISRQAVAPQPPLVKTSIVKPPVQVGTPKPEPLRVEPPVQVQTAKQPNHRLILEIVAQHFYLSLELLQGNSREAHIAHPRQMAMYVLRQFGFSFPQIGIALNKDHSTAMYSCAKISQMAHESEACAKDLAKLMAAVNVKVKKVQTVKEG